MEPEFIDWQHDTISSRYQELVSHPTHGFYTWVGGGEAIYAADGTLTQHNSLKFWDKRKRSKKYTCCGLQDYSLQISLRSASGWWRTSSLHFVYVIFLAPPVLKTLKISYGLGFYTLKDFLWWTMPLISILNCRILSTSILFLGVKCCQIIKTGRQFSSGTPPHTWWIYVGIFWGCLSQ